MATRMFTWTWIFEIVLYGVAGQLMVGRSTATLQNYTSCEEFERHAYFNPQEVVDSMWKIYYSWAENTELQSIILSLLTTRRLRRIKAVVDTIDPHLRVPWQKAALLMEPRVGLTVLLLHQDTPGAYRALITTERRDNPRPFPKPRISFADVRLKQVGRHIGMMACEELTAYALARRHEMPVTEADCVAAASKIGYRGPNGKSYLYVKSLIKKEL